jgi:hypothetical protein
MMFQKGFQSTTEGKKVAETDKTFDQYDIKAQWLIHRTYYWQCYDKWT